MDLALWHEQNNRYLAASLKWLRLRLEQVAAEHEPRSPVLPTAEPAVPPLRRRRFPPWARGPRPDTEEPEEYPENSERVTQPKQPSWDERVAEAAAERAAAARMEPPPALIMLSHQLDLSSFERDTLFLCAAMEIDTRIAAHCSRAHDDAPLAYPTFALAFTLFESAAWDALSPHRPLRYWRLIDITQPAPTPLTFSALRADERITNYIKGYNALDTRLSRWLTPAGELGALSALQEEAVETIKWNWQRHESGLAPLAQLLGAAVASKQLIARRAAHDMHRQLYSVAAEDLPNQLPELELLVRLWQRESLLLPLALYIDAQSNDSPEAWRTADRFLAHAANSNGLIFVGARDAMPELAASSFVVDARLPTPVEQREAWLHILPDEQAANRLASQFSFNLPDILAIADQAELMTEDRLWEVCCSRTRPRLDTLAQRLNPKATWEELVLPEEPLRLLHTIADQVRDRTRVYEDWGFARRMNRGMGISALFAGESGTGKTMAAEVIANDLKLDLYRIDLSAVVSKYIGETEKNLRRVFDAAEVGGAILFFDEADALFGKRSEVKDSHDRYANIEINYLLQRMEAFSGLAILATNMKTALDTAFLRRLRFVVNFAFPGVAERKIIWCKVFPPEVPVLDLDFDRLARLNLTGGNIHNAALNAAFLAARAGSPVTMQLVLAAARMEMRKIEKNVSEVDFRV